MYTSTLDHNYVNDNYPKLLEKYAAAIAADTYTPVVKFWEMPAAGCLTFMEITKKNMGNYLGFTDGVNAIFINENNYKEKFEEYLADTNNPKWENIARAGREYALNKLNKHNTLIDLSADFRLTSAKEYFKHYKIKHSAINNIKKSIYALPEIIGKKIK